MIIKVLRKQPTILPIRLSVEWIENVPDDIYKEPAIGFFDTVIVRTARRTNSYLITTEKKREYLEYALKLDVKVINPCLWSLATYYYEQISPKYIGSQEPSQIVNWIKQDDRREEKLLKRYIDCIDSIY